VHAAISAIVVSALGWQFGHNWRPVAAHVLLVAEWDLALYLATRWSRLAYRVGMAATCVLQFYLYGLNLVSNQSWGRNMTGHIVAAFAPTIWSEREPFPVGKPGVIAFLAGPLLAAALIVVVLTVRAARAPHRTKSSRSVAAGLAMFGLFGVTLTHAIADRDNLAWKEELLSSYFRPDGYAFEPSAYREAVADRDAVLRRAYPHGLDASGKNVILIIVDSLRADHMQVYGYRRQTTPFLSELVSSGRMKKVDDAFSTCSESFCGITSTLASREFRGISTRTFQLQDVLMDEGYHAHFLLSGNHHAWNGLPQFYHVSEADLFDGSKTVRYTMDDDRLVLEGLERVPAADRARPAFFYIHLMSPHYLGVQFDTSHVFTAATDRVSPGLEPYKKLDQLNKPDRYDDKILQADGIIRQLFDALAAKRYLDNAIVVITGDHGEGLGERHWAHGWHLYNEDVRIPLLIYDVPSANYPDLTFGAQVDIAPTIIDRLGWPIPSSWDGESLLRRSPTRLTHHQTYFAPNRFGVIYRDGPSLFKLIATPAYGKEELYDLRRDAAETHNIVGVNPALAERLRREVQAYRDDEP